MLRHGDDFCYPCEGCGLTPAFLNAMNKTSVISLEFLSISILLFIRDGSKVWQMLQGLCARKGWAALIGLVIGVASGAVQFWMLSKFTRAITDGAINVKSVLFGMSQFFLPIVVLLCCALLFPAGLMWSGIGMAASLLFCAIVGFLITVKKRKV